MAQNLSAGRDRVAGFTSGRNTRSGLTDAMLPDEAPNSHVGIGQGANGGSQGGGGMMRANNVPECHCVHCVAHDVAKGTDGQGDAVLCGHSGRHGGGVASRDRQIFAMEQKIRMLELNVEQLKGSHVALLATSQELGRTVRSSTAYVMGTEASAVFLPRFWQRPILFLSSRLQLLLRTSCRLFVKSRDSREGRMQANSIEEGELVSKDVGCTLLEFMALTDKLQDDRSFRCVQVPSPYAVRFADPERVQELSIMFPTYRDLCDALRVTSSRRSDGLFRERRRRGALDVDAVQVLGRVARCSRMTDGGEKRTTTKIFLGSNGDMLSEPILLHPDSAWIGRDWDRELQLIDSNKAVPFLEEQPKLRPGGGQFEMRWKKYRQGFGNFDVQLKPDTVLGEVRIHLPIVVLRGARLVDSAGWALANEDGGLELKEKICGRIE